MADEPSLFEQAADVLRRAMAASDFGQQSLLLEEALRLHRLAMAEEREKLRGTGSDNPLRRDPSDPDAGT